MTSDWQMSEPSPLFTMAPNIFFPLAFTSRLLHRMCDTTSSALTALSMDVMTGGDGTTAVTDLVALVDAVDELRVRGCPRKTDSCRVDRLSLHVAGGDGGYWNGWGGEEEKEQQWRSEWRKEWRSSGKKMKAKKQWCESIVQLTPLSLPASILMSESIPAAQVRADTAISLFLMTLTLNTNTPRVSLCQMLIDFRGIFVWSLQRRAVLT